MPETTRRLTALLGQMVAERQVAQQSGILYVDDGSTDGTWPFIEQAHASDGRIQGVKLAGNAGHQNALMAGLEAALPLADILVSVDADLQDDTSVIPEMVAKYREGNDIVYGVRRQRKSDTFFKRNTALAFYKVMRLLGVKSIYNHADYRLMSHRAVRQLCRYRERNLFLRGIVPLIGYRAAEVRYDRAERFAGESKYPLGKMLNFAVDGITSFSVKPVRLVFAVGIVFILVSLGILAYVGHAYFHHNAVPGWSSLILSLWFIGGCILVGLGIVGEYIGKIYLEVKDRPRYNVETTLLQEG